MKIQGSLSSFCAAFLFVASSSHAQVVPGRGPAKKTTPTALFPRQAEAFGVTVRVDEAGFAPLSRISKTLDSSPHFFVRWSTPNQPARALVDFKGFVPRTAPDDIYHILRPLPYLDSARGLTIFERVPPYVHTQTAQWEVGDPARTAEDNGAFIKTYDIVTQAPTRENSELTPETTLTTAHGTQIILKKVKSSFDRQMTFVSVQFIRPNHAGMDDSGADVYLNGGLLDSADDKGNTLKRTGPPGTLIQSLPTGRDVDFALEGVPAEGAKELHLHLSVSEYSTAFRNPARFKIVSIEIPVTQTVGKSDFKPTPAELTPTTKVQTPEVNASLEGKFEDGEWKGVLWLQSREKAAQDEGWTSKITYSPGKISAKAPDGSELRITEDLIRYLYGQSGHNDGTLASEDEGAYRVRLDSYGRTMPDTASFSVPIQRFETETKAVRFDKIPLPRAGDIVEVDAASIAAQEGVQPLKIAVVDEELKAKSASLSRVPVGAIVVVFERQTRNIFSTDAVVSGTRKLEVKEIISERGDFLANQQTGPLQTVVFATSSPIPQTGDFTLVGTLYHNEYTEIPTPLEFKDVPIKATKP